MSLSDEHQNDQPIAWGTIFSQGAEHSLSSLENPQNTAWSTRDENDYLDRVREKATKMATDIVNKAKEDAARMKQEAYDKGYEEGTAVAKDEVEAFRANMADSAASVMESIEGQCSHIFDQWRDDLIGVTRLAVETVTGIELSKESQAIMEALLVQSVKVLEKRRELVVRVNPEDEPMIADIIKLVQDKFPDVQAWRVRGDTTITTGGMVVESESSLAEGRVESRRAAVEEVLAQLTLPGMP